MLLNSWAHGWSIKGSYVYDFDIVTEAGGRCSFNHCCDCPTKTASEIPKEWKSWLGQPWFEKIKHCWKDDWAKIPVALTAGEEAFDEDGQPLHEFCNEFERRNRFNEPIIGTPHQST